MIATVEVMFIGEDMDPLLSLDWSMPPLAKGETIILDTATVERFDLPTNAWKVYGVSRKLGYDKVPGPMRVLASELPPIKEEVQ